MAVDEQGRTLDVPWSTATGASGSRPGSRRAASARARRVSWILPSRFEAFVLVGALARLGAVQNPILPIYRHREVGFIARQSGCRLLVVPGTFRGFDYAPMAARGDRRPRRRGARRRPRSPEGDPATLGPPASGAGDPLRWLFYTSGTTADPKGARHSDRQHRRPPTSACSGRMQVDRRRQGRGGVPDHPRRRAGVDVQHDGDRRRAADGRDRSARRTRRRSSPSTACTCAGAGTVFWLAYLAAQRGAARRRRCSPTCGSSTAVARRSRRPSTTR